MGYDCAPLPRVAADSEKLEPLLRRGEQVYVVDGPTRASGFDWYLVRPLRLSTYPPGWVAAADHDGTPWLAQATVDCPANPDLGQLSGWSATWPSCATAIANSAS